MARSRTARLTAVLFACAALPASSVVTRSADDSILAYARLDTDATGLVASIIPVAATTGALADPAPAPVDAPAPVAPSAPVLASPPKPTVDMAALKGAVDLYRKGDKAAGDAAAAAIADPTARKLLEWVAIRFVSRDLGFARIDDFIRSNPDWPTQKLLRRRAEEALVAARLDTKTVRAFFKAHPPLTAGGKIAQARALIEDNKPTEAAALVRAAWRADEFGPDMESRFLEAFPELIDAADHRARMEMLLFNEDWTAALRAANKAGPDAVKLAKARVAVGRSDAKAAQALEEVPKELRKDPAYLFAKAQLLRRQDKIVDAGKALAAIPKDAVRPGDADAWWAERRLVARKLLDAGEQKLAYDVASGMPADCPAEVRADAEFHAGWIALRFLHQTAAAEKHFAEIAKAASTPMTIARAAYWQGRAAEAAGKPGEEFFRKAAQHGIAYYGQLARMKLDIAELPVRRVLPSELTLPSQVAALRAVRLLYDADARDVAQPLLADLAKTLEDSAELDALARIPAERGDARALLIVGKAATQRGFPLDDRAFPTIGVPDIELGANAVEKPLVFAIARQESAFDPKVVSSAGARGLMQLMPATARQTAQRTGVGYDADKLTADPAYNAKLGAAHLGDLVGDWKGSYILTIASYNAGGGNVRKWIEAYGDPRSSGIDPVDWVERIPFTETRNYVQRVMENLQVYRTRLTERSALLIGEDLKRGVNR
ncbi:lytic transglycosylase domain-containing protein [Alsobacter metallidurans]|uniref:lytic transglycosylase domain-containing protein n=1 Tax=Alsobacter metallidurans TaxID=340221 RepID=UPI00166BFBB8|nr:transglycosylase SLT domain-containing protein [Alsobacter metallidurans]